ncbi:PfkB family carbohydrate kinase [Actinomycetaceae bacterium L2_0104]
MKLKDIARIADVSPSTISKIVNGKDAGISAETRERVLRIVREYHYTPYASTTAKTKTWTIGVLLRSSISLDTTLEGIIHQAQADGYATLVFNSRADRTQERKNIAALSKHKVDGIIWEPVATASLSGEPELEALAVPILKIGSYGGDESLLLPYEDAAYRITEELVSRGHRGIGCLVTPGRRSAAFLAGYRKCLFEHGMTIDDRLIFTELNDSLAARIADHSITGVISSHYRTALEFHQFMNSLRYRIPDDVSLISLKNDNREALAYPGNVKISTYTMRNADFGTYLCEKLVNSVEDKKASLHSFVQKFQLDNTATFSGPPEANQRKVVVVGSVHLDAYLRVPRLPTAGTTVKTQASTSQAGGKGVNQAVGVARLGHRAALIGNVGADSSGDLIYRAMERENVDTTYLERKPDESTGNSFIYLDRLGESMISVVSGANSSLTAASIRDRSSIFVGADCVMVQTEIPLDAVYESLRIARKNKALTILKPASCGPLSDALLGLVDILVPNRQELDDLCPGAGTLESKAEALLEKGAGAVIVTLDADGSYLRTPSSEAHFPADDVTVIDTTGACDAFISALGSYLLYGSDLDESIRIATYAAGYGVAHEGVVDAMINRASLENRVAQVEPQLLPELRAPVL